MLCDVILLCWVPNIIYTILYYTTLHNSFAIWTLVHLDKEEFFTSATQDVWNSFSSMKT